MTVKTGVWDIFWVPEGFYWSWNQRRDRNRLSGFWQQSTYLDHLIALKNHLKIICEIGRTRSENEGTSPYQKCGFRAPKLCLYFGRGPSMAPDSIFLQRETMWAHLGLMVLKGPQNLTEIYSDELRFYLFECLYIAIYSCIQLYIAISIYILISSMAYPTNTHIVVKYAGCLQQYRYCSSGDNTVEAIEQARQKAHGVHRIPLGVLIGTMWWSRTCG